MKFLYMSQKQLVAVVPLVFVCKVRVPLRGALLPPCGLAFHAPEGVARPALARPQGRDPSRPVFVRDPLHGWLKVVPLFTLYFVYAYADAGQWNLPGLMLIPDWLGGGAGSIWLS